MNENSNLPPDEAKIVDFDMADDNIMCPFQIESSSLRGRMVRMGDVLDDILSAHDYPNPVSHLVGEVAALTLLLSSMLKYDGIFTLQIQSDGPVSMLVADVTSAGAVRACASFDDERVEASSKQVRALRSKETAQNHLAQLLGKGHLAFTVDQGPNTERYQGIVELKGSSLIDCVQHYFKQSEQITTGIKLAVGKRPGKDGKDEVWRAGGIMVQHMPEDGGKNADKYADKDDEFGMFETDDDAVLGNQDEDDWRRCMVLMDSAKEDELLDPDLHSNILLFRLFNEDGVRVYESTSVHHECRCDEQRVQNVLKTMDEEDLDYMAKDGTIDMCCEFCSKTYVFDPKTFEPISEVSA
jgi:molecular chaperone Hsp33